MASSGGFVKAMRSELSRDLLNKPNPCHLLHCIAMLINRDGSPNIYGCELGEARIGYKVCGLTDAQYRAAKKYLQEQGLVEFYARGRGRGKKAYARLTSTDLYDLNIISNETLKQHDTPPNNNLIEASLDRSSTLYKQDGYNQNSNPLKSNYNAIASSNQPNRERNSNEEQEDKKEDIKKTTTTYAAVPFYKCLDKIDGLSLDQKKSFNKYHEYRVENAVEWAKTLKKFTKDIVSAMHWHASHEAPPEPISGSLQQRKEAKKFNEFLKERGHNELYELNLSAINQEVCYILSGGKSTTITLKNSIEQVKKDLEESKLEILKSSSNKFAF